jgi:hypothetical protein
VTCTDEHRGNASTLAQELADVLWDAGCTADAAHGLTSAAWRLADEIVRRRRRETGDGRPSSRPGFVHTPGDGTRWATCLILRDRETAAARTRGATRSPRATGRPSASSERR